MRESNLTERTLARMRMAEWPNGNAAPRAAGAGRRAVRVACHTTYKHILSAVALLIHIKDSTSKIVVGEWVGTVR